MRPHPSFSYPSHLPPLVDLGLLLLVVAVFLVKQPWITGAARWLETKLNGRDDSTSSSTKVPVRQMATVFVVGCLLHGLTLILLSAPTPWVTDERAYLLGADTFSSLRLTNPSPVLTPRLDEHLAQDHVLSAPTRQSKYPPGQSLLLTLGTAVGHPELSLTLAAGGLAASLLWALRAVLPAGLSLFGSGFGLFWVGLASYWNQSYWGGSLSAIAGAVILGCYLRLRSTPLSQPQAAATGSLWLATTLGLFTALIAATRPYEGLLFCFPLGLALLVHWVVARKFSVLLAAALSTSFGLFFLALYNKAVTGGALTMPHLLYTREGPLEKNLFLWGLSPEWWQDFPPVFFDRGIETLWFFLGTTLTLCLLVLLPLTLAGRRSVDATEAGTPRSRTLDVGVVVAVLSALLGQALPAFWWPHYPSPAFAAILLLALVGLDRIGSSSFLQRNWRAPLLVAAACGALIGSVVRLPAQRMDAGSENDLRQQFSRTLADQGGEHVIFVDLSAQASGYWMHNPAEPLTSPVLWARSLGRERDAELIRALDRTPWRLVYEGSQARLVRY